MDIRVGYRIEIVTAQPTPAILLLDPHPSRDADLVQGRGPVISALSDGAPISASDYTDGFGNRCRRLAVPAGGAVFSHDAVDRPVPKT